MITFAKTGSMVSNELGRTSDYLLWYARKKEHLKYRQLYEEKLPDAFYSNVELADGSVRKITVAERLTPSSLPTGARVFQLVSLESSGPPKEDTPFDFHGETFRPNKNSHWKLSYPDGMNALGKSGRIVKDGNKLRWKYYINDYPLKVLSEVWNDTAGFNPDQRYVVETRTKVIERCLLMTTDPGDLVFDPTCGSGTTAYVAERWGRRWITCDTSRVAVTLAKQRLMTAAFDYYELAHPEEGVSSGFIYKTVPHITLKSIANNPEIREGMTQKQIDSAIAKYAEQETLYDQPKIDKSKARVTGPFTVEAVPAPVVKPLSDLEEPQGSDESVTRSGETLRHNEWQTELLKTGVRGKNGQMILFSRVEPLSGTRWLHADAETHPHPNPLPGGEGVQRVVVSFGPEHAPLEQKQVEMAWEEARTLIPRPFIILFASFQFDPEAAKDIDELTEEKTGMVFLKVQMNTDLLTEDLKKKRSDNQSFWLIGQPDVELRKITKCDNQGQYEVEVHGFDYYNTKTGAIESGDTRKIAMWMLDTDYDGRSLYPRQVFFPMSGEKDGWSRLAKNLKAEIDEELIEAYRGTVSLPFEPGDHKRAAVKIVDDRGIESLKILDMKG